jgi:hypothetical protein
MGIVKRLTFAILNYENGEYHGDGWIPTPDHRTRICLLGGKGSLICCCPLRVSAGWIANMHAKRIARGLSRTRIITHRYLGIRYLAKDLPTRCRSSQGRTYRGSRRHGRRPRTGRPRSFFATFPESAHRALITFRSAPQRHIDKRRVVSSWLRSERMAVVLSSCSR